MTEIRVKRVYEPADTADGMRVLVDRLWPRGLSRERAEIDAWWRELSPSNELRRWYAHERTRWDEFTRRYEAELRSRPDEIAGAVDALRERSCATLLFSTRETERNNAVALREVLLRELRARS